jgi:hypothetical protein
MGELHTATPPSFKARVGYGILLPLAAFLGFQYELIESTRGDGTFAGMGLAFGLFWIVPALLVMNGWVVPIAWQSRLTVFIAGTMLPSAIGVAEFLLVHPQQFMRNINGRLYQFTPFQFKLFVVLLFVPMVVSLIYAAMRKWRK